MSSEKDPAATAALGDNDSSGIAAQPAGGFWVWLLRRLLSACNFPPIRIELWNGTTVSPAGQTPVATLRVRSRSALTKLMLHPDLYFGEGYMNGTIEVDGELVKLLEIIYVNRAQRPKGALRERLAYAIQQRRNLNTLTGSRANIHHHYDISNEFYALWLDRAAMQYTCAYFPSADATLEEAQVAKLDHVCRKLRLRPGETVVEAGCGWGGLSLHMAKHYGVQVRAYNISHEQIRYARQRAAAEGLADRVEFIEDDYRNIDGSCDAFVSVGMLEHVGLNNYAVLGKVVERCLKKDGRGLIHSIARNYQAPMNAWIDRRIFPGAQVPTLRNMMDIFEPNGFSVLDVENLRLHYALTVRHWSERYHQHLDTVRRQFDDDFVRAWRLYLAGSIAAFEAGQLQLFQVVFTRDRNNALPLTREHLYKP